MIIAFGDIMKKFTSSMTVIPKDPEKGRYKQFDLYIERTDDEFVFTFRDYEKNNMSPTYSERRIGVIPSMIGNGNIKEELERYITQTGGTAASSGKVMIGGLPEPHEDR
ncbi:MAG: hypothetical protein JW789_04805 [Candidatus Aenigmarchaeota archaeon]|nr:hypothetical protein [Candidatus Aenigmarchaeota archaeon]